MLALRECLMRESNSIRDDERRQKSVTSKPLSVDFENNLSSSTTANSSCQQQQSQQKQNLYSASTSQYPSACSSQKSSLSYITTAPAYYTDEYLRIQTPPGSPLVATVDTEPSSQINENYRSVYATPSKLITGDNGQKFFPKSPTATVAPPPIAAKRTIFRTTNPPAEPKPKGELPPRAPSYSPSPAAADKNAPSSVIASRSSFKPVEVDASVSQPPSECTASSRSSNAGRFSNKKRVVRVRSDSRPISALYDIICKEKGIELDQEPIMSSGGGGGTVGIDNASMIDANAAADHRQQYLQQEHHQHTEGGAVILDKLSRPPSSQLNSIENSQVNRYRSRSLSHQEDRGGGDDSGGTCGRLQVKPDILTTSAYIASELNHYQPFEQNHPDRHPPPHHPHHPHCNEPNLPSSCVDSSLNNYRDSSSYVNRTNELGDVHGAAGAGGVHHPHHQQPARTNGHVQQPIAAPRPAPRAIRDEKRRYTDGMVSNFVRIAKGDAAGTVTGTGTGTGTGSDGDSGRVGSQGDSSSGVGRRYITRSSRTPGGGGSNNSDSSPSPIPSASSQHRLTPSSPASNSISSNRLRSPLKSPSISRSTVYHQHYSSPTSAIAPPSSGSATAAAAAAINGNGNSHHLHQATTQQQQQHQPHQLKQPVDPSRSVMTNSVGAVAPPSSAAAAAAAASPLSEICGQSVNSATKHSDHCANGRLMAKSSSASSIPPSNSHPQHHSHQQNGQTQHHQPHAPAAKIVRTTKTSRLRAAALDKKKDCDDLHPSSIPTAVGQRQTSPRHSSRKPASQTGPDLIRSTGERARVALSASPTGGKKLVPSVLVSSMRQNLSELHYNGSSISRRDQRPHTTECTVKVAPTKSLSQDGEHYLNGNDDEGGFTTRPRSSTMISEANRLATPTRGARDIDLSPVRNNRTPEAQRIEDRDKSSKRKSNLNRSLNEEAIGDDDLAQRRRRRRELGMARQLIPSDETSSALRELIASPKKSNTVSPTSPRNDLAFHMENARRGVGLVSPVDSDRRRAQTASPKIGGPPTSPAKFAETKIPRRPMERDLGSLSLGGRVPTTDYARRKRISLSNVNQKVDAMRERTKSELAEIMKITEMCNSAPEEPPKSETPQKPPVKLPSNAINDFANSLERIAAREDPQNSLELKELNLSSSSASPRSFVKKDRISFDDGEDFYSDGASSLGFLRRRMLKARSVEREISLDQPKLSPILRRKSSDEPTNHIVSILKKKDQAESSSASSNASPVTFSSTTVDTPTRTKRQGILKKRSSLDESRYYSRSHSPDERSILVKSARRNSLEETQHGILKQSSYESKSDGCPSAEPHHGILKKKDSTSTPSESGHPSKHVSISQAVILAAAELCKDINTSSSSPPNSNDSEYDNIRPILKADSQEVRAPKPILKKKSSSETEEIRPILKTSRKSSREESSDQSDDQGVRRILKTDSPAKRRSFVEPLDFAMQRSRSLEHSADEGAVGGAQPPLAPVLTEDKPILSVAERVKNMERFLNATTGRIDDENSPSNSSAGAIPKILRPSAIKRDMYKERFRTQPVTNDEIQCLQAATSGSLDAFKPAFSLDSLNYTGGGAAYTGASGSVAGASATKISPRSLSSISPSPREASDLFSPRSVTDLNCISISSDSGLQTGKNFEMSSGLDDSLSKADESLSIGDGGGSQRLPRDDSLTLCEEESGLETHVPTLGRSGSVKARANMFQQLEEKTKTNRLLEEKTPPSPVTRRAPRRLSASPPTPADEPKTPNNPPSTADEDFEPSSLPLAERLRFFSSLSEAASKSSGSASLPVSRFHRPAVERRDSSSSVVLNQSLSAQTTPRSSIVPMDFEETPNTPTLEESSTPIVEPEQMAITPTSAVTPLKRIKLKTVGKLVMPNFLNDRNNNVENTAENNLPTPTETVKKIGKIKSPFIENNQKSSFSALNGKSSNKCMKYDLKSTPTSNSGKDDDSCDMNADSGKENYDNSLQGVELRKKKANSSSSSNGVSSAPVSQRNSYQQTSRSPLVDEKYAKYFGLTTTHDNRASMPAAMHKSFDFSNMPDVCRVVPKPHLRQQNFSENGFVQKSCSMKEVRVIPPSPSSAAAHASEVFDDSDFGVINAGLVQQMKRRDASKRTRAMTVFANTPQSTPERSKAPNLRALRNRSMTITHAKLLPNPITKYEDLKVTKEDLLMASREFERIFLGVV